MTPSQPSRRDLLRTGVAAGAGLVVGSPARGAEIEKPYRIAHLTDMHVQSERGAEAGFIKALESLDTLNVAARCHYIRAEVRSGYQLTGPYKYLKDSGRRQHAGLEQALR